MKAQPLLAVLCGLTLYVPSAQAVTQADFTTARTDLANDSRLISGWLTDQLREAVPMNMTMGLASAPRQLKVLGVEFGVEGLVSATKVDEGALHALDTTLLDPSDLDVEGWLPFPALLGHAKVGLPFGLDAGVRFGGIPRTEGDEGDDRVEVKNSIFGVDVRKAVLTEGLGKPGLTIGLNYTRSVGEVDITGPYDEPASALVESGGRTFAAMISANGNNHTEWETQSIGLQALLNKKVAFVNPYVGLGINRNWGEVRNTLTTAGTVTLTEVGNPANTDQDTMTASGSSTQDPEEWLTRALVGVEFNVLPFLALGLHGEFAGADRLGGGLGLRFQFR